MDYLPYALALAAILAYGLYWIRSNLLAKRPAPTHLDDLTLQLRNTQEKFLTQTMRAKEATALAKVCEEQIKWLEQQITTNEEKKDGRMGRPVAAAVQQETAVRA